MEKKEIVLTGITTSGTPHIGNYVGAILPAIKLSKQENTDAFYFLANYHSIIKKQDAKLVENSTKEIAATWLAAGLDITKAKFYRQSDIPEIPELTWILTCLTAKGLMNRAHAYKDAVSSNKGEKDLDKGITMGLFSYPILMAGDILMFNANKVPVGQDQIQHIEITRDLANKFNYTYKKLFNIPKAVIEKDSAVLKGLDGRKMSKSYNNTIPLFESEKKLRKAIMKIKTDSTGVNDPKDYKNCTIFEIYKSFAKKNDILEMKEKYKSGISWGNAKQELFEYINQLIEEPREKYIKLMENPKEIEEMLQEGAKKARKQSIPFLKEIKSAIGIK